MLDTLKVPQHALLDIIQYSIQQDIFKAVNPVNQAHTLQILVRGKYVRNVHKENLMIRRDLLHALIVQLVLLVLGDMHTRQDIMDPLLVNFVLPANMNLLFVVICVPQANIQPRVAKRRVQTVPLVTAVILGLQNVICTLVA